MVPLPNVELHIMKIIWLETTKFLEQEAFMKIIIINYAYWLTYHL